MLDSNVKQQLSLEPQLRDLAARFARVLPEMSRPCYRGRWEDRVRAAPAVSRAKCAKQKRTRAYRFSGNTPAFPRNGFTASFELSSVNGFLATVAPEKR
jgi:hypothetical protein